jgi:hypothetical protein
MKHDIMTLYFFFNALQVKEIRFDEAEGFVLEVMFDEVFVSRAEVVVHGHGMPLVDQGVNEMAAYESGAAGNKRFHRGRNREGGLFSLR